MCSEEIVRVQTGRQSSSEPYSRPAFHSERAVQAEAGRGGAGRSLTLDHGTRPILGTRYSLCARRLILRSYSCLPVASTLLACSPDPRLSRWVGCDYARRIWPKPLVPHPLMPAPFGPDSLFRGTVHYLAKLDARRRHACVSSSDVPGAVMRSVPKYPSTTATLRRRNVYPSAFCSPIVLS